MEAVEYVAPESVAEAVELLGTAGARPLAGGTDLVVQLKERRQRASVLVDVKRIRELNRIEWDEQAGLRVGAAVSCTRVRRHPVVQERYPALGDGASLIGSWQIQNRATLGGNLCNASPAADGVPALIAYGAEAVVAGPGGQRAVPVAQFCTGPGRTVLGPGELVVEFRVPVPPPRSGAAYRRFTPRAEMDIAFVGVAAYVELDEAGRVRGGRLALGAVGPTPLEVPLTGDGLVGRRPEEAEEAVVAAAVEAARPITDVRASGEYRRHLVGVLARRVWAEAAGRAQRGWS